MRIALAQIQSGTEPSANLGLVEDYTRRAADAGARLVLFPEATMCRFGVPLAPIAEPLDGSWASACARSPSARASSSWRACSSPPTTARVTNTLIAAGPGVDAHYDKIHLYDAFGFAESTHRRTGSRTRRDHRRRQSAVGPDPLLRHPVPRALRRAGAARGTTDHRARVVGHRAGQARAVDAAGPGPRAWIRRAVVAAVGQAYPGDEIAAIGPTGVGGSLVASPLGEVQASAGADPQLLVADIDLGRGRRRPATPIAVLRNRSEFTHLGKAESLR